MRGVFLLHMGWMLATNHCELREDNIREIMDSVFYGLVMKLKSEV